MWVREGYQLSVAIEHLPNARFLETDGNGVLFVSRPRSEDIIALKDEDGDGLYETQATFVEGMPRAHGMDFADGWLWFATLKTVSKARDTDGDMVADEIVDVLPEGTIPEGKGHWWRTVLVTDRHLYTSTGDVSNISDPGDTDRQKIWRYNLDGTGKVHFCAGIRNTEKLRVRPGTGEIWGFDHGSDWFGRELGDATTTQPITDLNPPDELNHYKAGGFYGHPWVTGSRLPRYEYLDKPDIVELANKTTPPEWGMPSHSACNGWTFIEPELNRGGSGFASDHDGDIFVAAHGSWNSSVRVGYAVYRVLFDGPSPYGMLKIVDAIDETGSEVIARPVDVLQMPDGSLLWSSDSSGRVYRLTGALDADGQ